MSKIGTRIIALFGVLIFIICSGLGLAAYITSSKSVMDVLKETMPKAAMEASITIKDGIRNQFNTLNIIASLDHMRVLKGRSGNDAELKVFMSEEIARAGHKEIILADKTGKVVYSNGSTTDVKDDRYFRIALYGTEAFSEPMLDADGSGIIMIYAVPVKIDGEISGVLMAVRDGLELSELAARIKYGDSGEAYIINREGRTIAHADRDIILKIMEAAATDAGTSVTSTDASTSATYDATSSATTASQSSDATSSATIASSDENSSASQSDAESSIAGKIGFRGFTEVQKQMMDGKTGFGEYEYNNVAKISGFAPIEKFGWSVAVAVDRDEMLSGVSTLKLTVLGISIVFLLAGLIIAYIIGKGISTPVTYLSNECNIMSGGDFSRVMEEKYTKRRDEIGDLARSFNSINVNVSKIIRNVVEEADSVGAAIKNVNKNMSALTTDINTMSGIIKSLSEKMAENSASAEELNATSSEIDDAIDSIANDSMQSAETAGEVSIRAEELKTAAIDSQKRAYEIRTDVAVKLREAIDQSKAVENIRVLSDAILDISSKTNLLALNAEIEASRAGTAGLGFSVVAGEIRSLAENSKKTANEIQNVTRLVVDSVQTLSDSAGLVLEFLEKKVVKDYDMLLDASEKYNNDAKMISEMVTSLSATTQQLYASIQTMAKVIGDVAAASEEGASETGELAGEAADVVKRAGEVLEKTKEVNESANRLLTLVSIFKV